MKSTSLLQETIFSSTPRYNTGDMVFFSSYDETYYGTIELIDDENIVLNLYQGTETIDPIDVTLERKWLDTVIRQDLRNQYLYDKDKVMYQNDHFETVQEVESSILIYQTVAIENYEQLHKIAPFFSNIKVITWLFNIQKKIDCWNFLLKTINL